jgi:hypothetical protein
MENMPPGNSFPQICVVSVNKCVEIGHLAQEYRRSIAISNLPILLISYWLAGRARGRTTAAITNATLEACGARRHRMV